MSDGKQNGASDAAVGWGILGVIFAALAYLVWWLAGEEIRGALRWVRFGEMWLISHFIGENYMVPWQNQEVNFKEWLRAIPDIPASRIDGEMLSVMSALALYPVRWGIAGIIFLIGIWAYIKGPGSQYITIFNLDGLIKFQSQAFPVISPFVKFNPANLSPRPPGSPVPAELPLFAEALGPEEWIAYNSIPVPDGKIDRDSTFKAFTKQLGPRWRGAKNLPPYKQILLASFCLKAARKRADADDMLGRLARCWTHDKGLKLSKDKKLLREARRILSNRDLAAKTLSNCNQHGWQTTALMRGLATAREEGGVLAPAQFVWLRAYDRNLWYPLNNLGRQSYHMEALGAMAHYKAEKMAQRPIPKPKVDFAVDSIEEYMSSDIARPIPQLDYSQSSKRGVKKIKAA